MVPERALLWLTLGWICFATACNPARQHDDSAATRAPTSAASAAVQAPLKGEQLHIPPSTFQAGTVPGEYPRDPALEQRLTQVTLGAFRIDRLPYPNDPALPPVRGLTQGEAAERCAAENKRLCTELEWELACKGPASLPFATGKDWNTACAAPEAHCDSPFKVLGLGRNLEWTASTLGAGDEAKAIARGTTSTANAVDHRCAHRTALNPTERKDEMTFRCCGGAPNAAKLTSATLGTAFRTIQLPIAKLAALLASDPHTAVLTEPAYFKEPDATRTVLSRGNGDTQGFSFTVTPLLWNPDLGTEFVIATGRAKNDLSFVVALLVVADDQYRVVSSLILRDEPGPVALAYSNDIRPRLHFSGCWGCPGENGKILYRKPDAVVITQP